MGAVIEGGKQTARVLNDLARHQQIVRLEQDILMDMQICEVEGWDKMEYINMLKDLISSFGGR